MKIAVLGGNSFSGMSFVSVARKAGHDVLPMARPMFDLVRSFPTIMAALERFKPNVVVNYAALNMVADSWAHAGDYYLTNVGGVCHLADYLATRTWLERFVQVSTPEVYGNTAYDAGPHRTYLPSTPYAVSRAAADMHMHALHAARGFRVCFTRASNVYGPGQQPYRIIPKTVLKIMRGEKLRLEGGGLSGRSFLHVRDMAEGTLGVATEGQPGEIYHFATHEMTRIRDLVETICMIMGEDFGSCVEESIERPGKDRLYQLDCRWTLEQLGWYPKIPLGTGLAETVAWFKAHAADYENRTLEYEHRP